MVKLFKLIDNITTAVDAVEGIEFVSDNLYNEITAYSAFIVDENVEIETVKIAINGQIYSSIMRTEFYLHVKYDGYTKAQFETLFVNVIKAIAALKSSTVFQDIKITDVKLLTPMQIGQEKTRTIFGTIEMMTKEAWV